MSTIFRTPARIELVGNHVDHQGGKVLTTTVDKYCSAEVVCDICQKDIHIISEGFGEFIILQNDFQKKDFEKGTSVALVRGILHEFSKYNSIPSFTAKITSNIPPGVGMASSAAFEILICNIINQIGSFNLDKMEISRIAKYSENVYYEKPCGMMDQIAISHRGTQFIDFENLNKPRVENIDFHFKDYDYKIVLVDCFSNHNTLTDDFSSIVDDMKNVCRFFKKERLCEVGKDTFYNNMFELHNVYDSKAINRCIHVFNEIERVENSVLAMKKQDVNQVLFNMNDSGISSEHYLKNIVSSNGEQTLNNTIQLCKMLLKSSGAVRVHGGGFAGTTLCIVPNSMYDAFEENVCKYIHKDAIIVCNEGGL